MASRFGSRLEWGGVRVFLHLKPRKQGLARPRGTERPGAPFFECGECPESSISPVSTGFAEYWEPSDRAAKGVSDFAAARSTSALRSHADSGGSATPGSRHPRPQDRITEVPVAMLKAVISRSIVRVAFMILALIAIAGASAATEAWHRCAGNGWEVTGADDRERALVCEGVAGATAFLTPCGVVSTAATRA